MSTPRLTRGELEGHFELQGELTMDSVPRLWGQANGLLESAPELCIDLSELERVDSAGLALLIEWTRLAAERGQSIRFVRLPKQMLEIARVSGLDGTLPLYRDDGPTTQQDAPA